MTQLVFGIGLLLALVGTIAAVRGVWATDRSTLWWSRNVGHDRRVSLTLQLFTSQDACALWWGHHRFWFNVTAMRPRTDGLSSTHASAGPRKPKLVTEAPWPLWRRLGFQLFRSTDRYTTGDYRFQFRDWGVAAPTWFILLTGGALTFFSGRALHRARRFRQRRTAGQCPTCGYDLRGAAHERCPECGAGVEVVRV